MMKSCQEAAVDDHFIYRYSEQTSNIGLINIAILLRAADVLDKRESEHSDHGYASSKTQYSSRGVAYGSGRQQRRSSAKASLAWSKSRHGGRTLHNEMEKNRRANLRHCLEGLKNVIPTGYGDSSKNTTLQLLKRARQCIIDLQGDSGKYEKMKAELLRQQHDLHRLLSGAHSSIDSDGRRRRRTSSGLSSYDGDDYLHPVDYRTYRQRVDSGNGSSPSSVSSPMSVELGSETSDDIDVMGTSSDADEYGQ